MSALISTFYEATADEEFESECEAFEWPSDASIARPPDWELRRRVLAAASIVDRRGRQANREAANGLRQGPLGSVALEVLQHLVISVDTGNSAETLVASRIAKAVGRSHSAVASALALLRAHDMLHWLPKSPAERL